MVKPTVVYPSQELLLINKKGNKLPIYNNTWVYFQRIMLSEKKPASKG